MLFIGGRWSDGLPINGRLFFWRTVVLSVYLGEKPTGLNVKSRGGHSNPLVFPDILNTKPKKNKTISVGPKLLVNNRFHAENKISY